MNYQNQTTISFIVHGQEFKIRRDLFQSLTKLKQQKKNLKKTCMPDWVSIKVFTKLQRYINNKDLSTIDTNSIEEIRCLLWIGDFLSLQNLQERLINQIIIPNLNESNCLIFLLESHKKLKNSDASPQCWYSLLNSCMTFIAVNISEMYSKYEKQIKKLNEKILSQILERSIKQERKNNYTRKHEMFKIIMECKQATDVSKLCNQLRQGIFKRKINPQIHANLAWKLTNLKQIQLKKTKIFKFIDYEWRLSACSIIQNSEKKLKISLLLQNKFNMGQSNHTTGTNNQQFQIKTQSVISYPESTQAQSRIVNTFQKIAVFYLKLKTKIGQDIYESQIRINYVNIEDSSSIDLLDFNSAQLDEVGSKKVELTLFCSIQPVYTFLLNYVLQNYNFSKLNKQSFALDEYLIMIKVYQKQGKYVNSFYIIWQLAKQKKYNQNGLRLLINLNDLRQISQQTLKKFCILLKDIGYNKLRQQLLVEINNHNKKKQEKNYEIKIEKQNSSVENRETDKLVDSRGFSRTRDSRSRLKKIFESPRKNSFFNDQKLNQKRRVGQEVDIRNFIYQKQSAFYKCFNDLVDYY